MKLAFDYYAETHQSPATLGLNISFRPAKLCNKAKDCFDASYNPLLDVTPLKACRYFTRKLLTEAIFRIKWSVQLTRKFYS